MLLKIFIKEVENIKKNFPPNQTKWDSRLTDGNKFDDLKSPSFLQDFTGTHPLVSSQYYHRLTSKDPGLDLYDKVVQTLPRVFKCIKFYMNPLRLRIGPSSARDFYTGSLWTR